MAFAGFLRTAELTCEPKNLESDRPVFEHFNDAMSHSITDDNEHSVVLLRSSKSDYDHTGVKIMVANTGEETCRYQHYAL